MLHKYFDKIVLITLKGDEARVNRCIESMMANRLISSRDDVHIHYGIRGDDLNPPAWWRAGNGAWGCLCSHRRVLEDAWYSGDETTLILEDDVVFVKSAESEIERFMDAAPDRWGQIYLGGQHTLEPFRMDDGDVFSCHSVNRTHAYAVSRSVIPRLLQHIQHAPDYIHSEDPSHIDHQLERAHRRGDWTVFAPVCWIAGQGENHSQINGRYHTEKWWDWRPKTALNGLPFIAVEEDHADEKSKSSLHFGWKESDRIYASTGCHPRVLGGALSSIADEAWCERRLPAFKYSNESQIQAVKKNWKGDVLRFDELGDSEFAFLLDWKLRTIEAKQTAVG